MNMHEIVYTYYWIAKNFILKYLTMEKYDKGKLIRDLIHIQRIFLCQLYSSKVIFVNNDLWSFPLEGTDVECKSGIDDFIIPWSMFSDWANGDGVDFITSQVAAASRAGFLIGFHERFKWYCKNSTEKNEKLFSEENKNEFTELLFLLKVLRDSATHWNPGDNTVHFKKHYWEELKFWEIVIKKDTLVSDVQASTKRLIELTNALLIYIERDFD